MKNKTAESQGDTSEDTAKKPKGLTGTRLVAVIAAVAVVSLLAGVLLMQFIVSPAEIAARSEAPEPGPVTAVIEERVVSNEVVIRGEASYADSVEVKLDTSSSEGRPIVTGQVPAVGAILNAGSVALEVTGRPVIVLQGQLPAYRSLSIGMSGPDVLQLKQTLASMGYDVGDPNSDLYEWQTSEAVGQLFLNTGYQPSTGGPEARDALRAAEASYRSAETALTRAQTSYNTAYNAGEQDLAIPWAELNEAQLALGDASTALEEAQIGVQPTLPAGEVLFLPSLPRRVDAVYVERGGEVSGAAMLVSGADLTIVGTLNQQDAALLTVGMEAFYSSPSGEELTATIASIEAPTAASSSGDDKSDGADSSGSGDSAGRYKLTLTPGELTDEQITALREQSLKITIPVASTEGEVMAVPLAALSAAADGSNVVELLAPTKDDPFATEMVAVTTGLGAQGFVEITSDDSRIAPGAKVVVGR